MHLVLPLRIEALLDSKMRDGWTLIEDDDDRGSDERGPCERMSGQSRSIFTAPALARTLFTTDMSWTAVYRADLGDAPRVASVENFDGGVIIQDTVKIIERVTIVAPAAAALS